MANDERPPMSNLGERLVLPEQRELTPEERANLRSYYKKRFTTLHRIRDARGLAAPAGGQVMRVTERKIIEKFDSRIYDLLVEGRSYRHRNITARLRIAKTVRAIRAARLALSKTPIATPTNDCIREFGREREAKL